MGSLTQHPDPETLLRLVDDDLPPVEAAATSEHVRGCAGCLERLNVLQATLDDYGRFHQAVLKPSIPPAPDPWTLHLIKPRAARVGRAKWLAAAAAIAAVFLLVLRFENAPEVRAAELLRKAAVVEQGRSASGARRIRIRTRSLTLERSARFSRPNSESADAAAVKALFVAAGYSWEEPLTVAAFSHWRDSQSRKQDELYREHDFFLVRTSTQGGVLSDAALTLRAADLHAVAGTLRFRAGNETIDISEVPVEAPLSASQSVRTGAPPPAALEPGKPVTASDELSVMAALHGVGADLGEPIEIQRENSSIVVRVTGLDEHRREQIRAALMGLAAAQLRFEDSHGRPAPSLPPARAAQADRMNPLIADLRTQLGNDTSLADLSDQLIDATDRATERAFALRVLARHFSADSMAQLSRSEIATLHGILSEHTEKVVASLQEIGRLIGPILPASVPPPAPAQVTSWQSLAESLPASVEQLDRTLNGATDNSEARKRQLAGIIAKLNQELSVFQNMVRP